VVERVVRTAWLLGPVLVLGLGAVGLTPAGARAPVPVEASKPLPAELALIPHDAGSVVTVRPRTILSRLGAKALSGADDNPVMWGFSVAVGVAIEDVERITVLTAPDELPAIPERDPKEKRPVVSPDPAGPFDVPPEVRYTALIITTRNPLTHLPFRMGLPVGPTMKMKRRAEHRGHLFTLDDDGWNAWLRVGDRTVVFGSRATVEWVIDQMTGHAKGGPLGVLISATRERDFVALVRPRITVRTRGADSPLPWGEDTRGRCLAKGFGNWLAKLRSDAAPDAVALASDLENDRIEVLVAEPTERAARARVPALGDLRTAVLEEAGDVRAGIVKEPGGAGHPEVARLDALGELLKPLDNGAVNGTTVSGALPKLARAGLAEPLAIRTALQLHYDVALTTTVTSDEDVSPETYRELQIARALGAYHDKHKHYPDAAITDKDGKPLLSWRVALLPDLGFEDLYKRFKLDEPWDSAHNAKLLDQIPWAFSDGTSRRFRHRPTSSFHLPVGPGTLFEGGKGRRKEDATDGADQTVVVLRLNRAVPWTKPVDAAVTAGKQLTVGGEPARVYGFVTADGKARSTEQFTLLGGEFDVSPLLTRAGGELKMDIDRAVTDAIPAAGFDKLDEIEVFSRVLKSAGIDVPKGLEPPKRRNP
jgi:hypothetical protein